MRHSAVLPAARRHLPYSAPANSLPWSARWLALAPLLAILVLMQVIHSDATYLGDLKPGGGDSSPLRMLAFGATYLWAAFTCARQLSDATALLRRAWVYLLGVGFGLVSMLWSDYPRNILIDAAHALGILLVCIAATIGTEGSLNRLCRSLNVFFALFLSLCVLVALVEPDVGQWPNGRWRGITYAPNSLGLSALLGIWSATVILVDSPRRSTFSALACLGVGAVCLAGSNSVTSLILSALIVVATPLIATLLRRDAIGAVFLGLGLLYLMGIAFFGLYVLYPEVFSIERFLSGLGRDATLTGRTAIWSEALAAFHERPTLGWSFDGLRTLHTGRYAHLPTQMHSGYVHILVLGGLVGAGIVALLVAQVTARTLWVVRVDPLAAAAALVALLAVLGHNVTEASFYRHGHLMWLFFILILTHAGAPRVPRMRRRGSGKSRCRVGAGPVRVL